MYLGTWGGGEAEGLMKEGGWLWGRGWMEEAVPLWRGRLTS